MRWVLGVRCGEVGRVTGSDGKAAVPLAVRFCPCISLVAFPPIDEQVAIAAFLDRETAKIDALVEEQQRLIALLKEKRQAVISHAVTKGLDPNAPMKDSGVEWLGEAPAHWEVRPLGRLLHVHFQWLVSQSRGRLVDDGAIAMLTANEIDYGRYA